VRLNYIWEWSIHYRSLSAMFTLLHSSTNQELFEKYVYNQSRHYEKYDGAVYPSYHLKLKYPLPFCQLCSTRYTAVRIKNCLKSTSVIKATAMKSTDDTQRKPSCATTELTLFTVQQRWMEHKGGHPKNALQVLRYAKRHLSGWSDVEQRKNQARSLSRYRVTLVWRHQLVS